MQSDTGRSGLPEEGGMAAASEPGRSRKIPTQPMMYRPEFFCVAFKIKVINNFGGGLKKKVKKNKK